MKENQEIIPVDGTGQKRAGKKLPYEKPMIGCVKLFADQVLSLCLKNDASCVDKGGLALS
jgi:hypothetical protein